MLLDAEKPAQEYTLIKVSKHKGTEELRTTTNHKLYNTVFWNVGICLAACTTGIGCMTQTSSAVSQFADTVLYLSAIPQEREKTPEKLSFHYQRKKCSICNWNGVL